VAEFGRKATGEPGNRPWVLLCLPPFGLDAMRLVLGDLPAELVAPATRDQAAVQAAIAGADLVLGDWAGALRLGEAEAEAAARLAFVQQPSVGVDSIDVAAFTRRGIPVANTAGANAVGVAEWCIGATFVLLRSLAWADAEVQAGRWPGIAVSNRPSVELAGREVGIVGMGPVGHACAHRFAALGANVSYWSRNRRQPGADGGATYRTLDELCAGSQVLVVVIALGEATRRLIDPRRVDLLPKESLLVNAARGGIVDEEAVAAAVRSGAMAGAAFDVFATEPLAPDSPLRGNDRILLSPHAAGATKESINKVAESFRDNLRRAITGQPVFNLLNDVSPVIVRRP
jgi:phosphoglycerate dehydrogenase-like enzyme